MKFLTVLSAFGAASIVNAAAICARGSQTCYSGVYIIVARGTFEQQDITGFGFQGGLVSDLLQAIPNSNASSVVYPASAFDYGTSVQTGAVNAQQQIVDYNAACPTSKIVLLGYSQGAQVIGQSLTGGPTYIPVLGGITGSSPAVLSQSIGANIVAINLLGDPNRAKGQGLDQDPMTCSTSSSTPRNGTTYDNFQPYSNRLSEFCHQGDPVCCSDGSDAGSHVGYLFNSDNVNKMVQFIVDRVNNGPLN